MYLDLHKKAGADLLKLKFVALTNSVHIINLIISLAAYYYT